MGSILLRRAGPRAPGAERGSVLVLALIVTASTALIGMWMVFTMDLRARARRYLAVAADSARAAKSGLEIARHHLGEDSAWPGATVVPAQDPEWTVAITTTPLAWGRASAQAIGTKEDGTQTLTGDLRASGHPSLGYRVCSASTITFNNATLGGYMRANGDVAVIGALSFFGTLETLDTAFVDPAVPSNRVFKTSDAVVPPAVSVATIVADSTSLVGVPMNAGGTRYQLIKESLSPTYNPYGPSNSAGCYVLDAGGLDVVIQDTYIKGCLTVVRAGSVIISGGYHHVRADASYPTLVVGGNIELTFGAAMEELILLRDVNLDGDMFDTVEPLVRGVVYATGSFTGPSTGRVEGTIAASSVTLVGNPEIKTDSALGSQPVREFTVSGAWNIVAGSIEDS